MSDIDYNATSDDGVVSTMNETVAPGPAVEAVVAAVGAPATATETPEAEEVPAVAEPVSTVAAEAPEAVDEDPEAVAAAAEAAKPKAKAKGIEPWMQKRLDEQTARQRAAERDAEDARRANAVLQATIDALRKGETPDPAAATPAVDAPPEGYVKLSDVKAEAKKISAADAFNARADQAFYAGKATFPDFQEAIQPLIAMGALGRFDFQEAALATDSAPEVLHYLGSNPEEASRILDSLKAGQSAKAVAEMTKIAVKVGAQKLAAVKKPVSKVPAPIVPVGGSAVPVVDMEKASMEAFSDDFDKKARANGWY